MDAPDSGNAIGRGSQLRSNLSILRCPGLQRKQAYDHLYAIQQPMIGLVAQNRLLLDQLVPVTKESLLPGESLPQTDFRAPMSCQLAFVARNCAAPETFKDDIRTIRANYISFM